MPGVGSRLQSRLSRGVTVPYIARTATGPRSEQAAVGELVNETVSNRPGLSEASSVYKTNGTSAAVRREYAS